MPSLTDSAFYFKDTLVFHHNMRRHVSGRHTGEAA